MGSIYYRWANTDKIPLTLQLVDPSSGLGVTGKTPEVAIRRYAVSKGGALLDNWYWDGAAFQPTPQWHSMGEVDATDNPGLYLYLFDNPGNDYIYLVYYRHTAVPAGFDVEMHLVSDEVYVPASSPAIPILPGDTVMGRLAAMENPLGDVAQANADAVWDETLADHLTPGSTGAALNAGSCGGVGAYQIDISVEDDTSGDPLPGAQIDVYRSDDTFLFRVWTDINGERSIGLDAGAYKLLVYANGYTFTVPININVTANAPLLVQGTSVIPPPAGPELCVIFGTVRNAAGDPIVNACVEAFAIVPQVVGGVQYSEKVASVNTDVNGQFTMPLRRETTVRFVIESTGVDEVRTVPDADTQDIATWTAP